jgi:hypothetical protein
VACVVLIVRLFACLLQAVMDLQSTLNGLCLSMHAPSTTLPYATSGQDVYALADAAHRRVLYELGACAAVNAAYVRSDPACVAQPGGAREILASPSPMFR